MLAEIIKLVSRPGDLARLYIADPPPPTGIGNGTWTRVPGVLAELQAMIAVYRQLAGLKLPSNVEEFARDFRMDMKPEQVVGDSMSVLGLLQNFAVELPGAKPRTQHGDGLVAKPPDPESARKSDGGPIYSQ